MNRKSGTLNAGRATAPEFPAPGSGSSEFGPPAPVRATDLEFHALSEDMPPLEAPPEAGEPVPVLTRTTLPPFEAPVPGTDPMGVPPAASSLGDEDTLVRAMERARGGQTDPYAPMPVTPAPRAARLHPPPPSRSGTDPYAPGVEPHARQTDPYAQALSKDTPSQGTDEIPTPPSQPVR